LIAANALTDRTFDFVAMAIESGIKISLENPWSSRMFHLPRFVQMRARYGLQVVKVDMCAYGMPYRKSTAIWTSPDLDLTSVGMQCSCTGAHTSLSGWRHFEGESRMPTREGASYPPSLCEAWAAALADNLM
jgi:hypothetical protein